jgi:hypothetical protein
MRERNMRGIVNEEQHEPPYGLGGAIFPPQGGDATVTPHEHMFCFVVGEHGAIRGCELCGKS